MKRDTIAIAVAAALGLGLLATGSLQAYGPGWGPGGGMMHPAGYGRGAGPGPCARGAVQDLGAVKSTLGITADQASAWQGYVDAVRERAATRAARREALAEAVQQGGLGPQERLDLRARFMEDRLAVHQAYADAVRALYGVLTPEQQAAADRLLPHGRRLF